MAVSSRTFVLTRVHRVCVALGELSELSGTRKDVACGEMVASSPGVFHCTQTNMNPSQPWKC